MKGPRLGVLGWPVAHSLSPAMHNATLAEMGLADWTFQLLPVPPELFEETARSLPGAGFVGASVTVPHKEHALALADLAGEAASSIGAANTLVFDGGSITAENTDAPGFLNALPERPAAGTSAMVLGAGGSARAAAWALQGQGVNVRIWNRTAARARALADDLGVEAVEEPVGGDVLVNCTVAGMEGDPFDLLPLRPERLADYETVVDFVYADPAARLLEAARAAGCRTVDGIEILVQQGALALETWTGREVPVGVMAEAARAAAGPPDR